MKKLYRRGTVHPSLHPSPSPNSNSNHLLSLSFLPTTILSLAVSLSASDLEVLSYLLSCSSSPTPPFDFHQPSKTHQKQSTRNNRDHPHLTCFTCYCFTCYTSYWARWDSSPNRQLIHEIIDAFEDHLLTQRKKKNGVNKKRKTGVRHKKCLDSNNDRLVRVNNNPDSGRVGLIEEVGDEEKQGTVIRKMMSFIWGSVWG